MSLLEADKDGFVLQVEGASIDKRDHAADVCGQIGETLAFDNADRRRARLPGPAPGHARDRHRRPLAHVADDVHDERPATGSSYATVQTVDNTPIRVSYGTGKTPPGQTHTGARIPVMAVGPQATNVMGARDQTDLFATLIGRQR